MGDCQRFLIENKRTTSLIILYLKNNMDQNQPEIESSHNEMKKENLSDLAPPKQKCPEQKSQLDINRNGFTRRITLYQILPVLYACLMMIQIGMIAQSVQSKLLQVGLSLTYSIISILLGLIWFKTTSIDPTDNTQILHKQAIKNELPFSSQNFKYFCHICQTCVSKDSFHCRKCNRCVQLFDHHCKWLNNCIGAKNYLQFLALIFTTQLILLFHIIVNSLHFGYAISHQVVLGWLYYAEFFFVGFDSIFFVANSILVAMHLYLVIKKKTTLQLILERRKENKIFPSQPKTRANQAEDNNSYPQSQSDNKIVRQLDLKVQRQKNLQKMSLSKPYSFKARSKSIKVKFNNIEK